MIGAGAVANLNQLASLPITEQLISPKMPRFAATVLHAGWNNAVRQVLAGVHSL